MFRFVLKIYTFYSVRAMSTRSSTKRRAVEIEKNLIPGKGKKSRSKQAIVSSDLGLGQSMDDEVRNSKKFIGAHVSAAGGLANAPINAADMGAKAFALFVRSQRQWVCNPLEDEVAEKFRKQCQISGFSPDFILPHGSYLLNCGAPNAETLKKSREALLDELQRCEKLGLTMYNFHPGSTCGTITLEECLDRIGDSINMALKQTKHITAVIENMSRQGFTVGGDFKELSGIIDRVEDKSRIGVCLDTCHAFAAGHDLCSKNGYQEMMEEFDDVVGLKYLKALHLNDSKAKLGTHLDRHASIGKGYIGADCFKRIVNDPRFDNMPLILETPYTTDEVYAKEIRLLYSFGKR